MNNNVLIVFIKYPEPGNVKTRLIPELGEKGSAKFYSNLVKNILTKIKNASNYDIYIFYTGNNENNFKIWLGNSYFLKKQTNGNIGSKMYFSLKKNAFNL